MYAVQMSTVCCMCIFVYLMYIFVCFMCLVIGIVCAFYVYLCVFGYVIMCIYASMYRLVEESRQARLRLEQSKSTAASVLRQQVFHFDPVAATSANAALVAAAYGNGTIPPQMMIGGPLNVGGSNVLGGNVGAAGSNIVGNSNNYGTSGGSGGSGRYTTNPNQNSNQNQLRPGGPGVSSVGNNGRVGGAGVGPGGRISDENSQEEMLRSYFPGWF